MLFRRKITVLIIISFMTIGGESLKSSSLEKTFKKGVEAFKGERWTECINKFEEAIHLHKLYKTIITNCRLMCSSQQYQSQIEQIEDLKMYEKFFNIKICLKECHDKDFEDLSLINDVSEDVLFAMQARKPYEYLHTCYFQMYNLPKAASATYTYLVENPNDGAMKQNLQYYADQPEVNVNEIVDLQNEEFAVLYDLGIKSYKTNNWAATKASMEAVVTDYLSWENGCRAECETLPAQEWSPEFVITISNHIASLLHCRQQCQDKVKLMGYNSGIDFLADVLNFVQISNYHLGKFDEAAKAVSNYLALLPNDEDMVRNKEIYSKLASKNAFTETMDIIYYLKRDKYEKLLLSLFNSGYKDNLLYNMI